MNAKVVAQNSMPSSRDIISLVITVRPEGPYDAYDCPMCGCQVIAKERKREYIPFISTDEEDTDDEQI